MSWVLLVVSLFAIGAALCFEGDSTTISPALFPLICAGLCAIASMISCIKGIRGRRFQLSQPQGQRVDFSVSVFQIIFISVIYVALIQLCGFIVATLFFIPAVATLLGYRRYRTLCIATVCWACSAYFMFVQILKVPL